MPHDTPLIATLVIGIVLAFVFGAIVHRLRLPPLVGYLLAGVAVGPFTPGYVADQGLAPQLAEIGVILLMFGVGMHFSLKDLLSVKAIAIPGALVQIAVATALGMGMSQLLGWPLGAGFVFGLALSVASTVVLIRALQERRMLQSPKGQIAVGWLIVEDLAMVLALVLLPAFAGLLGGHAGGEIAGGEIAGGEIAGGEIDWHELGITLGITLGKVAAFVALMLLVGRRVVPWILHYIAHTGSRELFRLAVLAIGLGIAYGASALFGVSFALGAFFAGMILGESELSHRAAEESLPLRDAFAVLFFVSVGMLFDPHILLESPWLVVATLAIILFGKSIAACLIVLAFRYPLGTALTISASLAQIGEFSFILAALGMDLGLLPKEGQDLIVAGALLSILVNPLFFMAADRVKSWLQGGENMPAESGNAASDEAIPVTRLQSHAVVVGYGRVGRIVADGLRRAQRPFLVIEERQELADAARGDGIEAIFGNAAEPRIIAAANLAAAKWLLVAIPNAFEAGQIVLQARKLNVGLDIVARAHSDAEVDYLGQYGATLAIMGEREIGLGMLQHIAAEPGAGAA